MVTSEENNNALASLNDKLSEIMFDNCILASFLLSLLFEIFKTEHTSHFRLIKESQSDRVVDLLINQSKPITLSKNLLTIPDTDK